MPTLASIHIYPVKSTRALGLPSATVQARGLEGDRRWMLVDRDGQFLSQRTQPQLTQIRSDWTSDGIWLHTEGIAPLFVPTPEPGTTQRPVRIWKDTVQATPADEAAASWCRAATGWNAPSCT